MELSTRPLTGMRQLYPSEMAVEAYIVSMVRKAACSYGFEEYDGPTIEPVELFLAKSGGGLISEQGYSFEDRGGRRVVLRPEMTPSLARMIASAPEVPSPVRWMSFPLCFRYERPQRGRVREFRQFNLDILGETGSMGDLEVMLVLDRIMKNLGALPGTYRIGYSGRGLATDVLRAVGIAPDEIQRALGAVDRIGKMQRPEWLSYAAGILGSDEKASILERFASVRSLDDEWLAGAASGSGSYARMREFAGLLEAAGLASATFDASVVRGLDYYTGTVFETFLDDLPSIGSVCSGGRYDNLAALYTKHELPGIGASLGLDRLLAAMEELGLVEKVSTPAPIFIPYFDANRLHDYLRLAATLRAAGLGVEVFPEPKKLGQQLKYADRRGFRLAVVAGENEFATSTCQLKDLTRQTQQTIPLTDDGAELIAALRAALAENLANS